MIPIHQTCTTPGCVQYVATGGTACQTCQNAAGGAMNYQSTSAGTSTVACPSHTFKLLFWNAQRLGRSSDAEKQHHAFEEAIQLGANVLLMCEITSDFTTDYAVVEKQLSRKRRARQARSAALGYGAIGMETFENVALEEIAVPHYSDTLAGTIRYHGGQKFDSQSSRAVAKVTGTPPSLDVYLYHANASYKGKTLVSWIGHWLVGLQRPFVLVGDLNCCPEFLEGEIVKYGTQGGSPFGVAWEHDRATHNSGEIYDYVIHWGIKKIDVKVREAYYLSDHDPIFVSVTF